MLRSLFCLVFFGLLLATPFSATAQSKKPAVSKEFSWVNPIPSRLQHERLEHHTFTSPSMKQDVGYCIYLPEAYQQAKNARFPVIYYLHGGRPGSETKSIQLVSIIDEHISAGTIPPMIYVFVNGGPVSHYNMPNRPEAQGADVFVKELIPHIDATYRTVAKREGRGIEGFSQGGRGTTRIMFRHPELFVSAAPGGSGYATEKRISENDGFENPKLQFGPGDNTWDLARAAAKGSRELPRILVHVGTKDFNYEANLEYMDLLEELNIPFEKLIVPDVPHSAKGIYEKEGLVLLKFHAENFRKSGAIQ